MPFHGGGAPGHARGLIGRLAERTDATGMAQDDVDAVEQFEGPQSRYGVAQRVTAQEAVDRPQLCTRFSDYRLAEERNDILADLYFVDCHPTQPPAITQMPRLRRCTE